MKGVKRAPIIVGFGALAAFGASAEAASIPAGPYVGVVGGYEITTLKYSASLGNSTEKVDSFALDGARAGVVAGWSSWSHNMYGALELNGAMSTAEGSVRVDSAVLKLESKETYGASLLLGGRVVPGTLLYGRVGWQRMKARISGAGESDNEWFDGIRAGAGGMWALSDAVALRLEYTHSFY
ncbi:MAG TPA: outer membrane beta-barrel protein, partial [Nitrococcus sp.]|nr:outer membrane beta-barrel protein [Nitrococcus sp.]